ncbi:MULTISPECIES: hypothetical protein [Vibrio]|uniref:Uncharacterized protein n=1 Tax=Vibrio spartinae TaxID=1918945 RepID=A0A1N6M5V8_9VIBR|nr:MULTISPECIES: hypothetical protein [Vibrio]WNJ96574.1 hypothetical protein RND59_05615 [Vibrio ruber]SIO94828.1 hypothetical protein VSP9026_02558 [Vibrio spartinae]
MSKECDVVPINIERAQNNKTLADQIVQAVQDSNGEQAKVRSIELKASEVVIRGAVISVNLD